MRTRSRLGLSTERLRNSFSAASTRCQAQAAPVKRGSGRTCRHGPSVEAGRGQRGDRGAACWWCPGGIRQQAAGDAQAALSRHGSSDRHLLVMHTNRDWYLLVLHIKSSRARPGPSRRADLRGPSSSVGARRRTWPRARSGGAPSPPCAAASYAHGAWAGPGPCADSEANAFGLQGHGAWTRKATASHRQLTQGAAFPGPCQRRQDPLDPPRLTHWTRLGCLCCCPAMAEHVETLGALAMAGEGSELEFGCCIFRLKWRGVTDLNWWRQDGPGSDSSGGWWGWRRGWS